ncbi:SMC domain protein [[Leptolyngbya] sp. PCC 7376]|uniref:AAA family ATPase n=1 Tax=[Leptolyngbya] sp. PCC 7376 TaxID=111781 RepID=UPI00029EF3C5|nr:AAA family ATPase [[Leptolyngbya] sp. PCC 7376]AFY39855.1 SMC domain protein [[Leptolyngbya] sp. PCC 7376]
MLKRIKVKNFKSIRDSKSLKLGQLNAFIGANGSGKSSLIESLLTYQMLIQDGLDEAMNYWGGFEFIRNRSVSHTPRSIANQRSFQSNPITFNLSHQDWRTELEITCSQSGDKVFIRKEELKVRSYTDQEAFFIKLNNSSNERGIDISNESIRPPERMIDDESIITAFSFLDEQARSVYRTISDWQFIDLNPSIMGLPNLQRRTDKKIRLNRDGSNIAEYLLDIREKDLNVFNGIVETLQFILPYAQDLQPNITSQLERKVYLQLSEAGFKIPGWLLSTGTLRLVSLLAVLRHPEPPPLIVIEEIENGLDPSTIHLIVDELSDVVREGKTQIIITTHSPYLLDLLDISHIVLVERNDDGEPTFTRPENNKDLYDWAEEFRVGELYTMSKLKRG